MPVNPLGLRTYGRHKSNDNTAQTKASLSWTCNAVVASDGDAQLLSIPGIADTNVAAHVYPPFTGWQFTLDPTSVQSSFTFGNVKALQIAIQRPQIIADLTGPVYYFPGRVVVQIPSTGQTFIFTSKVVNGIDILAFESEVCIVPTDAAAPGLINVYIQQDDNNGTESTPSNTLVNVTAFNYDVAPVGGI